MFIYIKMRKNPQKVDNKINKEICNLFNKMPNNPKKKLRFLERSLKKLTITTIQ